MIPRTDSSECMGRMFQAATTNTWELFGPTSLLQNIFWYLPNWTSTNLLCVVVLTFYSTRLARQKFYLEKKLSSESSRVKLKNGIHSTRLSFHCFVSNKFQVLVWRTLSIRWSSVPERPQFCIFEVPKDLNGQNITYLYQLASQIYKIVADLKYRLIDTP